jgi:TldD protein
LKIVKRRDFVQLTGLGIGGLMLPFPIIGNPVSAEALLEGSLTTAQKKELADAALNVAKSLGATYTDVRIGRY